MCFQLYAATMRPIPRREWNRDAPDISVTSLDELDERIRAHFTLPEVQYIGSDTCCGCGFPHAMYQNGGWPELEWCVRDTEQIAEDDRSRATLGALLRCLDEEKVELYGVWAGDQALAPASREELSIEALLDPSFYLKERGFYTIHL